MLFFLGKTDESVYASAWPGRHECMRWPALENMSKKPPVEHFFGKPWGDEQSAPSKPPLVIKTSSPTAPAAKSPIPVAAPIASTVSEDGTMAKAIMGSLLTLTIAYVATSIPLADDSLVKPKLYQHAIYLGGLLAFVYFAEFIRTNGWMDTDKYCRSVKYGVKFYLSISAFCLVWGAINLAQLHRHGSEQRLQAQHQFELQRITDDQARQRLKAEAVAQCEIQKATDIDSLEKRRNTAAADHKKCLAEWTKPNIFSNETAQLKCTPKQATLQQLTQYLRNRKSNACV
jgi:hypothetical protein